MFSLSELYDVLGSEYKDEICEGRFACALSDASRTFTTNLLRDTVACFTFTLVRKGYIQIETNGRVVDFAPNDLYIYIPGLSVKILSASDDYESIVLLADEDLTYQSPAVRNVVSITYLPIAMSGSPKISLTPDEALHLEMIIRQMRQHIIHPSYMTLNLLNTYYSAFIMELTLLHDHAAVRRNVSRRSEEIFAEVYGLMRHHFLEHRDLSFYAQQLNITTIYLSRIVRELSGCTAVDLLDRMLLNESVWMLRSTSLTISQIADRLHFSSPAAFCKFFRRMTHQTPKEYRR